MLIIERRLTWCCYGVWIPGVIRFHFHVGFHDHSRPGDRFFRVRELMIAGCRFPFRYAID